MSARSAIAVMPRPIVGPVGDGSFSQALRPFEPVKSAFSSPAGERQARERFALIEPILLFDDEPQRYAGLQLADGSRVTSATALAKYIAERHSVSPASIWRWKRDYTRGGIVALEDKVRSDKGNSRFFERNPQAAQFVAAKYWTERLSVANVYRALLRELPSLCISDAHSGQTVSYETVRAFLANLPAAPTTLARQGERAFNERHLPYLSRAYTERANQVWVSDHLICDVLTWDDCFSGTGQAMRLRLTMVLDFRTRKAVGWTFCEEGSSWTITTAVRNAVLTYGPCEVFYCDNGKDYRKVAKAATAQQPWWRAELETVTGLLAQLGIRAQHCLKYHPQSKHVERFFATVHSQFDSKFTAGYTTGDAYKRPDLTHAAAKRHGQMLKAGEVEGSPLPPASVYIAAFDAWVREEYGNAPHTGKGMDGRSPNEVFEEEWPVEKRPRIHIHQVAHLFYERERRKVDSCAVRLNGTRYIAATPEASAALLMRSEEYVQVAYDRNDRSAAVALDDDGNLIAPLVPERLLTQSAAAQPAIAASMAERRRMQRSLKGFIAGTAAAVRNAGQLTEREHLELAASTPEASTLSLITRRTKPQPEPEETVHTDRPQVEDIADRLLAFLGDQPQ